MPETLRVDIREMIRLIGDHLYTTPNVVIRELIQNAYDSILGRYGQAAATEEGRISVRTGRSPATLVVADNGAGMDRRELVDYLSTLGQGIKKASLSVRQGGTIGEFGIGFFASFMIADEIIVTTRKVGAEAALRWRSRGVEEYEIEELSDVTHGHVSEGTEVKIILQRASVRYSEAGTVKEVITRYCDYLGCPIYLDSGTVPLNSRTFPWEVGTQAVSQRIERHLGRQPLFWMVGKATTVKDARFFLAFSDRTKGTHQIYCKRMFVTDTLKFVPDHLNFIDVVLNSDALSLGMNREQPRTNKAYNNLAEQIEEAMMSWLRKLISSERANPHFLRMMRENQVPFRRMALESRNAFDKLYDLILFRIAGSPQYVTISDYLERNKRYKGQVFFLREKEEEDNAVRRPSSERLVLAAAQETGALIIGIRSDEDDELLRKVCTKVGATKAALEMHKGEFLGVSADPRVTLETVRKNFERFLNTRTQLRSFPPTALPLILEDNSISLNASNPFLSTLGGVSGHYERVRPLYIHLQRVMRTLDRSGLEKEELIEITSALTNALEAWCEEISEHSRSENKFMELERWWAGPPSLEQLPPAAGSFRRDGRDFRYRCFIACPFSAPYRDVVNVVKSVMAAYGIYAETAEASDTRALMEKICLKIDQAQFAVVDVSESNRNVLFELGILLARRKPTIIIRNTGIAEWTGERVPSDVVGVERIEYRNTSEDLREKLSQLCERVFGGSNAEESEQATAGGK